MNRLGSMATLLALAGLAAAGPAFGQTFRSDKADFRLDTVAEGLEHPWSLAFLPDGSQLVTEREGRLRRIENGELQDKPIAGVPELVVSGQGGLLDVILHPDFENNRTLFLSYAHKISRDVQIAIAIKLHAACEMTAGVASGEGLENHFNL